MSRATGNIMGNASSDDGLLKRLQQAARRAQMRVERTERTYLSAVAALERVRAEGATGKRLQREEDSVRVCMVAWAEAKSLAESMTAKARAQEAKMAEAKAQKKA